MGFLQKTTNRNIQVRGIKDDVMYQDSVIEHNYTIFGVSIYKTNSVEIVNKHAEFFDSEEDSPRKLGFSKK